MVICLERGADLHMAQLMPLPLTVSCFSKIRIGFTFLVPAYPGSPGQRAVERVCVCGDFRGAQMSGGGKSGHGRHNVLLSVRLTRRSARLSLIRYAPFVRAMTDRADRRTTVSRRETNAHLNDDDDDAADATSMCTNCVIISAHALASARLLLVPSCPQFLAAQIKLWS